MLGVIANKQRENQKYIYSAKWIKRDKTECCTFRFAIVNDDNTRKTDFNKLSGFSGDMTIVTKSTIDFSPMDVIVFRCQRYTIEVVDGNRKEEGEQAMAQFITNGNIPIYLTLRKAG